ncbi:SDR family NAD(P)-dependent oxidoreductase [Peribacillus frigoritolerans]|uniref:SDR family NAD(P)-dependent oxidoreductase n=1 Tax=Peribacillus frigoritolerans TaxID=450367 RepID=UPI003D2CB88E
MSAETVLITGATKGIGYEFTKVFAEQCYNLVLVSRDSVLLDQQAESLKKEYGVQVNTFAGDLSSYTTVGGLYRYLKIEGIDIDILINNAGAGGLGLMTELDIQKEMEYLQLNMISLTYLTRLIADDMVKRKQGKILNVASTAAFQPTPRMSMYGASKSYVLFFGKQLRKSLKEPEFKLLYYVPLQPKRRLRKGWLQQEQKFSLRT